MSKYYFAVIKNFYTTELSSEMYKGKEKTIHNRSHYSSHLIVVKKLDDNWYQHANSSLLFHTNWIEYLVEVDVIKNIYTIGDSMYLAFLRYDTSTTGGYFIDDYSKQKVNMNYCHAIYDNTDFYETETISIKRNSKLISSRTVKCYHCNKETSYLSASYFSIENNNSIRYVTDDYLCDILTNSFDTDNTNIKYICMNCYYDKYTQCHCCGSHVKKETLRMISTVEYDDEVGICNDCYYTIKKCKKCGLHVINSDNYRMINSECFCNICNRDMKYCNLCGDTKVELIKWNSSMYCKKCFEKNKRNLYTIYNYNYKTEPIMYGKDSDLHFGFEFEMDLDENKCIDRNLISQILYDKCTETKRKEIKQYIYNKHDGSLKSHGDLGLEVVTHPMTYKYILKNIDIFDKIFSVKNNGCYSFESKNCGFHIHMSKKAFTKMQLFKFLSFVYNNKEFVVKISERKLSDLNERGRKVIESYCTFNKMKIGGTIKSLSFSQHISSAYRYSAINLSNKETVEIRIFKGTLEKERFLKNLEFCMALYEFTKDHSLKDMVRSVFKSYLINNKVKYPNLYKFITNKYRIGE